MHLMTQGDESRQGRRFGRARLFAMTLLAASVLAACGGDDDDDNGQTPPTTEEPSPEQPAAPIELTLLHINDHHSHLDETSLTLNLANAAGETVEATVPSAGFPRVTAAMQALSEGKENVIKIHAGDALTGTLYFNRAGEIGEADAAMMNTVCFDSFTLGNHEFDKGDTELKNFIDRLHGGDCKTPVISANVRFGASSALNASNAPGYVEPYTIVERDGQKIGIVGLTIAGKTKQSSSPDPDTDFEDEATAAQTAIDALKAEGVNKIIVSSHIGYGLDKEIIPRLSGVDVVIGGDSHTLLGPDDMSAVGVGSPAGAYAEQLTNADGEPVCIGQAWEYSQIVGEMTVSFDADGVVTSCAGTPHVLIGDTFTVGDAPASATDNAALLASAEATGFLYPIAADAAAQQVLDPYQQEVEAYSQQIVASAPDELCSRRVPGGPGSVDYSRSSAACNALGQVDVRGGDIQQLVAQAYLEVANASYGGADMTLQSGGGVRVPLQGNVTAANVIEVLPFGNMLYRLDITGAEAMSMVEDGLEATFGAGGTTGPYPYTGGLRFDVDATKAAGSRASDFEVLNQETGLWEPIDASRTYRLFVLSFNATGGDGYATLANVPDDRRLDVGVLDADVFQAYIDGLPERNASGLPILQKLDDQYYSTKRFVGPSAD